ncbi:MAG: DUF4157 domain-containing protein [Bryobacteraceae bacterium]|nr:DUF4157 domain-containing protein [Bryobacteraceae bacterium]
MRKHPPRIKGEKPAAIQKKPPATPSRPAEHSGNRETAELLRGAEAAPLEPAVRSRMESALGENLEDVRVHTDREAQREVERQNARAFAIGNSVAFGRGEYAPGTPAGDILLAHELAHVIQQRKSGGKEEEGVAPGSQALEGQANAAALGAMARLAGRSAPGVTLGSAGLSLQRCDGGKKEEAKPAKFNESEAPWTPEAVVSIIARTNPEVIRELMDSGWTVIRFDTAFDTWKYDDGREEEVELTGLLGNTRRDKKEIRLRSELSNKEAASTLVHESTHARMPLPDYLEDEIQARVVTEKFHIAQGWDESGPGFRNADGTVNEAEIRRKITGSSHYNPVGRKRIGRRYVGEKKVKDIRRP